MSDLEQERKIDAYQQDCLSTALAISKFSLILKKLKITSIVWREPLSDLLKTPADTVLSNIS